MGSSLAGYLSDRTVIRYRKLRGGVWVPEDRLRTTVIGGLVLVPMSVLLSGVFTTWVGGTAGIVLNLLMLFVNGIGVSARFFLSFLALSVFGDCYTVYGSTMCLNLWSVMYRVDADADADGMFLIVVVGLSARAGRSIFRGCYA